MAEPKDEALLHPVNLDVFLPYACLQLNMPFLVSVQKRQRAEYVPRSQLVRKLSRHLPLHQAASQGEQLREVDEVESVSVALRPYEAASFDSQVNAVAVLDAGGRVVELQLERCLVPCPLLKLLQLLGRYQPALERLTARRCRLTCAALAELAALPPLGALTDVCLDDSPVLGGDFGALLDHDRLRRLSLARCGLGGAAATALAARLAIGGAANRSLLCLELVSNRVGDAGARALAAALRTNRTLLHLNLADNLIGDEGGRALLAVLAEFPLTADEVAGKRRRRMAYVKRVAEAKARCLVRLGASPRSAGDEARRRRTPAPRPPAAADQSLEERAELLAREAVGPDSDPYGATETVVRHGRLYCRGDWALVYLNLAHNSLTPSTVAALERTLAAQVALSRGGLVRVVLDGNELPLAHQKHDTCGAMLERAISAKIGKHSTLKRIDRPKTKS